MTTATNRGGRLKRVLAAFLCLTLFAMLFPTEALAFGSGQPVSSFEGDIIVGSDGASYNHPAPWSAIIYNHSNGAVSEVKTYNGGQAYRYFGITSASGESRWAYCIEGGVGFEASTGAYTPGSSYFNVLPRDAQYGIMLATLYGWKPGAAAPAGCNAADYYMATQVIVWEYQQQLRVNPHNRQSNGYYSNYNQYYSIIAGRPAERAYNWILDQIARHNTIPSFCSGNLNSAQTIELKWDTTRKLYELTLVDTNNTGVDLQVLSGSGVTISRSGNRYTFTSTKMIMNPISFQFRKNIPVAENMLVWGRPGKQTLMTGTADPVTFFLKIKTETYGWAKIIKTSEDGIVEGITFTISGTNVLGQAENATVTTGPDGVIVHKILPGTYTVTEYPIDRYVTPRPQTITIESGQTSSVSFYNILKKFQVIVTKTDVENGYPQGDAKLAGAVYGIFKGEQLIDTYTTDANGQFTTKFYICDIDWTIREIAPSEGYLLDSTVYPVGADPRLYTVELNTTEVHAKEQVIKGDIRLIKHTDEWDPNIPEDERDESANKGKIEAPEVGAVFQIFLASAGSYDAANEWERDLLTTDEYGMAQSKKLPYGRYTVHQVAGAEGKNFIPDFTVYIRSEGQTYQYILNNDTIMGRVRIEKRDAETDQIIPLAGVGFKVRDLATGEFISQTVWYPNPIVIDTFYTSDEGWLMLPDELPYGNFEAVEVETCYGYVLDGTPVPFTIDGSEAVVTVVKHNMPQKGKIIIHKEGEIFASVVETDGVYQAVYGVAGLEGSTFDVIADEDIITPDGTLRAAKDEVVATVTTGPDGYAETDLLYLGRYRLVETHAAPGMVLNPEEHFTELTYAGQEVEVTTTEIGIYNERQRVAISLEKTMERDDLFQVGHGEEYMAIQFGLFAAEDITAADGTFIPTDGLLETISLEVPADWTAEEVNAALPLYGKFMADVPFGSYYVQEQATDKQYILSDTKYPVVFEYAGQDIAVIGITAGDGQPIENKIIRGNIKGIKVGEEGQGLEGAVIGLFRPDDTERTLESALMATTSAEDGSFQFEGVPFGHWVVAEIAPPAMHKLSDEIHHVYVGIDGQVIEIRIENTLIRGNVQLYKTDADNNKVLLEGAVFEVYEDVNGNKELDKDDVLIGEMDEISTGIHEMRGLVWGNYLVLEKVSPTNFHKDGKAYYFEIRNDGETVVVQNAEGKGFTNKAMVGHLRIIKTSSDGKMDGFTFRVTGPGGYDKTFTTPADGIILIQNLRIGRYTVTEVSDNVSAGYVLPGPVSVDVPTDQTVEVKFHNNKVTVTVPKTGDETNFILYGIILALGLAGAAGAGFFYLKKRKKALAPPMPRLPERPKEDPARPEDDE